MAEAGVGIFFCVSVERSRGGNLEGRTGRRLLKVGGVRLEKKKKVSTSGGEEWRQCDERVRDKYQSPVDKRKPGPFHGRQ